MKITITLDDQQAEWYKTMLAETGMGHADLFRLAVSLVAACNGLPPCPIGRGPGNPDRVEMPETTNAIRAHLALRTILFKAGFDKDSTRLLSLLQALASGNERFYDTEESHADLPTVR
jgi:hypothetical protein